MTTGTLTEDVMRPVAPLLERAWRETLSFIRHYPLGAFGAAVAIYLLAMAIVPQLFTAQDPNFQILADRLDGPSGAHWFGTDQLGRDMYTRIVYGARTAMLVGFGLVTLSAIVAIFMGTLSGYFGGLFDLLFQRVVDIGIALPGLIFIILVVTTLRDRFVGLEDLTGINRDIWVLVISLSVLFAVGQSRVIRGITLATRQQQYIDAANALGATHSRIILRHILPNIFAIILVQASITVGAAILVESALSFLGYGVQPPEASWGRMISDARQWMIRAPHLAIFPGVAIFITVWSFNMLGDAMRDKLDPRLRGSR
ncbi:MAG: ABC transporter permease [Dehalococcoidia bacterium]